MSPTRVNRREFLTLLAVAAVQPPKPLPSLSWTCPMHSEVVDDQGGACPICKMPLTPVRLELVWSCQLHLDVTQQTPGTCRTCGRQLVRIIKAPSFRCPSHPTGNRINPGRWPID